MIEGWGTAMVPYMKWKIYDLNSFGGWRSTHSLRVAKAPEQLRLHALALVFDFQPTQMFGSKSGYELRDIRRHWPTRTLTDRGCGCSCRDPGMSVNLIVEAFGLNKHTCSMTLAEHDGRVSQRVTWNIMEPWNSRCKCFEASVLAVIWEAAISVSQIGTT